MLSSCMSKSIDSLDVGSLVSNGHLSVCEHLSPDSSPTLSRLNQVPDIIQIVGRNSRNGNGTEDKYAFLLDQKDDHIPLHKTIHCAMCKNKEDRKLKAMQESSVFETSHSIHALRSQRLYRHQHSLGNLHSLPPCMESDVPMSQTESEQYPTKHNAHNSHPESVESSETDLCNGNGHIRSETEDALDSVTPTENLNSNLTAKFNGHNQPETENALEANKLNGNLNSKSTVKFNGETYCNGSDQTAETKARPLSDDEGTKSPESDCVENGGNVGLFRRSQSFRVTKDPAKTDRRGPGDPLRRHKPQEYSRESFQLDTLSPKDQKMISVLLAKKEKEQEENRLRESNHLRWEEERISSKNKKMADLQNSKSQDRAKDKSIKTEHERESRDVVFRRQKTADGVSSSKQRPHSEYFCSGRNVDGTCSCGRDHNKPMKLTTLNKRLTSSETGCNHKDSNDCLAECCSRYASSTGLMKADRKQEKAKAQLQQALDRKKLVEERLEEQQRKTDNYLKELKEKQELELERASTSKRDKHEQVKQKVMQHNETARQKFEQIKESQKQTLQDKSSTHESIDANLTAAEMKARRKREEESARTKAELQSKIEKSQRKQQQMEEELRAWHDQILTYRQQQAKHAEELFQAQLAKKREAASKVRESKERQQENMQRMLEMEKEWKASVEASIHSKEARSKMLQQEKEAMIQKSRAQAQMTRRMREDLRLNYSMNDLDRLSKQVLLQNKVFSP